MDVCFDLVVRTLDMDSGVRVDRRTFYWEGQEHVDPKVTYHWGPHFELVVAPRIPAHIAARLGSIVHSGAWTFVSVRGDGLDLCARELEGEEVDWQGHDLESLLRSQLKEGEDWAVVFAWECERSDERIEGNRAALVSALRANLSRLSHRKGFLAVHRATSSS